MVVRSTWCSAILFHDRIVLEIVSTPDKGSVAPGFVLRGFVFVWDKVVAELPALALMPE